MRLSKLAITIAHYLGTALLGTSAAEYPLEALWLVYVPPSLTLKAFSRILLWFFFFHKVLRVNEHYILYSINWLVFIPETECVHCAVRTVNQLLLI